MFFIQKCFILQKKNIQNQNQLPINNIQEIQTPPYEKNNRKEEYINQFEMRQKEYNQMLEKKAPNEINFSENFEDSQATQIGSHDTREM